MTVQGQSSQNGQGEAGQEPQVTNGRARLDEDQRDQDRRRRFTHQDTLVDDESTATSQKPAEAPAGFDNLTNGFDSPGPAFESLSENNVRAPRSFNDNRFIFEEFETAAEGLGPTYNAQSCRECHQNVVTGGASQVTEQRTGHLTRGPNRSGDR